MPFIIFILIAAYAVYGQSPHGENFKYDCSLCHESVSWKVTPGNVKFNHDETAFKLLYQHSMINCTQCHKPNGEAGKKKLLFGEAKTECFDCHKDVHQNTVGFNCERCHTPETWLVINASAMHQQTRFPLTGAHAFPDCIDCHKNFNNLRFEQLSVECYSCHAADYAGTNNPNHIEAGFSTECEDCHTPLSMQWSGVISDHSFFPLTGGHKIANCFSCHTSPSYKGLSRECYSCHRKDYEAVKDPDHVKGNLPKDCSLCHTINAYAPSTFNHAQTDFPLTGAHTDVSCAGCHQSAYAGTPEDCRSCHQQNYNTAINPSHTALQLPGECSSCHTTNAGWKPASFTIHDQYYQLLGAHASIKNECITCHNGNYNTTPNTCYGCHQKDFDATTNPKHSSAGFGTNCQECHSQAAWQPANFDHDVQFFPVNSGKHKDKWSSCADCHSNSSNYTIFSCIGCHEHNKNDMDSKHSGMSGYIYESNACYGCHPKGDKGDFDHNTTGFPLTGSHINVECGSCHTGGFSNTSPDCKSCHQSSYNTSANPSHTAVGIPVSCQDCHNTTAWVPSNFNHANTNFPLTGSHIQAACTSCHKGITIGLNNACISCHESNYNSAPQHAAQNYPKECTTCHNTTAWNQTTFDHQSTAFPLTGAHTGVNCSACHSSGFTGTPATCSSCHQDNYNNAANPSHTALQLPSDCNSCHTTNPGWSPATFSIHDNYYKLLGAHAAIKNECITCHNGNYNSTPNTCYGCHQDDYNRTTNPAHSTSGFSTDCNSCHTQTAWRPSTFNHDASYFPIYSGKHRGQWNTCSECHTNSSNFKVFSCINCHEHNKASTDQDHNEVSGYRYDSQSCYNCHPRGVSEGD